MSMRWLLPISAARLRRVRSLTPDEAMCSTTRASNRSRAEFGLPTDCSIWYMYHMVQRVSVYATTGTPADVLYGLLKDPLSWTSWSPMDESGPHTPAAGDPNGVGSTRAFATAGCGASTGSSS